MQLQGYVDIITSLTREFRTAKRNGVHKPVNVPCTAIGCAQCVRNHVADMHCPEQREVAGTTMSAEAAHAAHACETMATTTIRDVLRRLDAAFHRTAAAASR